MRRASIGTAALLAGVLLAAAPPAVYADYSPSDFPSTAEVSDAIGRAGTWSRYVTKTDRTGGWVVGARPSDCASDRSYAGVTNTRSAHYSEEVNASGRQLTYSASVSFYKFPSEAKARAALKRVQAQVRSCPRYTEWVCTQCDGIFDIWQRISPISNVGDRTVAWAGKSQGNIGDRYRSAAVLDRNNIIKATVATSIFGDPNGPRFPTAPPTKTELRDLAETAYATLP